MELEPRYNIRSFYDLRLSWIKNPGNQLSDTFELIVIKINPKSVRPMLTTNVYLNSLYMMSHRGFSQADDLISDLPRNPELNISLMISMPT